MVPSELLHPTKIIDDQATNPSPSTAWDRSDGTFPLRCAFFALQQQWIQENGGAPAAALERDQIQNPRLPIESKPKPIHQQYQRPPWQSRLGPAADKSPQRLAKTVAECRDAHTAPTMREMTRRVAAQKHISEGRIRSELAWASALFWTNRPGLIAARASPSPLAESDESVFATGRFRMPRNHTCEVLPARQRSSTTKSGQKPNSSTD